MKEAMEAVIDRANEKSDGYEPYDKTHAISGFQYKIDLPRIHDADPDLDRYNEAFDDAIACQFFGKRPPRDVELLHLYGKGFDVGSTRRKVYDNYMRMAKKAKRVPKESQAVLEEIKKELRTYIWECILLQMHIQY